jgi:hypothetical protein
VFLINMNLLFERFVGALLRHLFSGSRTYTNNAEIDQSSGTPTRHVATQRSFPTSSSSRSTSRSAELPSTPSTSCNDERSTDVADIMQTFLCAYSVKGALRRSALLYPAGGTSAVVRRLEVRSAAGEVSAEIEPVPVAIDEVCGELHAGQGTVFNSLLSTLKPLLAETAPV